MESNLQKALTFRDLWATYRRRQTIVYRAVIFFGLLAAVYCIFSVREYEATAVVQVENKNQDRLGIENLAGGATDEGSNALEDTINIQTQARILQSDTLALKTIEALHMEDTRDFKPHWSPISWVLGIFSPSGQTDPANASLEESPQRRRRVLSVFSHNLSVSQISGTRLMTVSYLSSDPKLAAAVVNKLMESLIDYSFQTRFDATNQAAGWLSSQLGDLRQQSEELQRKVADLQSKSGVYSLGTVDPQGHDQTYSGVIEKLQQATVQLSQSEQNRILRGAILHAAENGDAEMLSGLAGNTSNGSPVNSALTLIQDLRGQEATQEAALQQAELKYGPAYPKLAELRGSITALQHSIQQEIGRLTARAKSDYDDATQTEAETRNEYDKAKAQADALNNKSIDFTVLRQEADESRKLYQELLERFKQAGVLESLKGSTIEVVDPGRVADKPKKPSVPRAMAVGIAGGFFLGSCFALLIDLMDSRINTIGDAQSISGGNLLGVTPAFNAKQALSTSEGALASLDNPQFPFIEAMRTIRTRITLKRGAEPSTVILVTSSVSGEGKSTVSANLAVLLAQSRKRVLLIDTDLRLGALQVRLNLPSGTGLSELLASEVKHPEIHPVLAVPQLDVLHAGARATDPSELLGSETFSRWLSTWREEYDYVVMDSAPILPVSDSLSLAPLSDITLLVARPGHTRKSELAASIELLESSTQPLVAVVLNGLRPYEDGYSSYFSYPKAARHYLDMVVKAKKMIIGS
jgi:polysaccharide biosynthesis transport protein